MWEQTMMSNVTIGRKNEEGSGVQGKSNADSKNPDVLVSVPAADIGVDQKHHSPAPPTVTPIEKGERLIQSTIPFLGLLITIFLALLVYVLPDNVGNSAPSVDQENKNAGSLITRQKLSGGCLQIHGFRRYLDRPEEDESFYCDPNERQANSSVWI